MQEKVFNPKKKPVVLWGAGEKTRWLLENRCLDFPVEFIIDSDKEKGQTTLCGLSIFAPESVQSLETYFVLIVPEKYKSDISAILSGKHMQAGMDYLCLSDFVELYRKHYEDKMQADVSGGYKVIAVPAMPIGDVCTMLSFFKAYTEKIHQPLALYVESIKNRNILQLCPYVDKIETLPLSFLYCAQDSILKNCGILDARNMYTLKGEKYLDGPAEVKLFLGLANDVKGHRVRACAHECMERAERIFKKYNLIKGKTVFLIPYGDWLGKEVVSEEFWLRLCDALRKQGYALVFNAEREIVPGVPSLFLDVMDIPAFSVLCGNVVGARTGLINYIAFFTDVMIQAIWPGDDNPHFGTDYWKEWCEAGGISPLRRSGYFMKMGLSIRHETGRNEKMIEFIHGRDERDIAFIVENLDRMVT